MSTVLVVEDEFGIADLFDAILSDEGYRVLTAINGQHALEVLAKERADLIFTDFMMPVLDGPGLLRAMADDPALRGIPVVLMSSLPETTVAKRCSGYVSFMRKPFNVSNVIETAARFLVRPDGTGA
jgi:CheY-like chemotaxis protein